MKKECESADASHKGDMETKLNKYTRDLTDMRKKVKKREDTLAKLYNFHTLIHSPKVKSNTYYLIYRKLRLWTEKIKH